MSTTPLCPSCGAAKPTESTTELCSTCLEAAAAAVPNGPASTVAYEGRGGSPPPAELAGQFPQLEILELLGRGGMGEVYRARQVGLNRIVALKILPQPAGDDTIFAERFTREARTLAALNHPHIVTIYDFGERDGRYFFIMEHVQGGNLRQRLRTGPLRPPEVARLAGELCGALQYAHDAGIVHRDIKPENILLDRAGRVKVADFGLAKLLAADTPDPHLTGTRHVMGTPHYMAPEQVESPRTVDHRADIFALGVVLYEMMAGVRPAGRFAPLAELAGTDPSLDAAINRALAPDPAARYARIAELGADVQAAILCPFALPPVGHDDFLEGPEADLEPPPAAGAAKASARHKFRSFRTHPVLWLAGGLLLLCLLLWLFALRARPVPSADPRDGGIPPLIVAARDGNSRLIDRLLREGHGIDTQDGSGRTALMWAAERGNLAAVRALLHAHAEANLADHQGVTALMLAALNGQALAVDELLRAQALPDEKTADGDTALMLAASEGHATAAERLLRARAAVNLHDREGQTALMRATLKGHVDVVRLLLAHKAEVDAPDARGRTALMAAAFQGRDDLVRMLTDAGADPQREDASHWTAALALGCRAALLKDFERAMPLLKPAIDGRPSEPRQKRWFRREVDQPWPLVVGQAEYRLPNPGVAVPVLLAECDRQTDQLDQARACFAAALAAYPLDTTTLTLYEKTTSRPGERETLAYSLTRSLAQDLATRPQTTVVLQYTRQTQGPTGRPSTFGGMEVRGLLH